MRRDTDLKQYLATQGAFWAEQSKVWVQETADAANIEIVRAGNPKFTLITIDGTLGKSRRYTSGHTGSIFQATKSVRVLYQANDLAMVANSLRPILSDVIRKRFPNSHMNRLARDWVWWAVRRSGEKDDGKRMRAEQLGGSINVPIGIYDILYLVPDSKQPAEYAWFANNLSKLTHVRKPQRRRKDSPAAPRDRRLGYLGEAVRRMRGKRAPGVVIWGMFIDKGLTAPFARNKKGLLPAVGVAFDQSLNKAVGVNS